MVSAIAHAGGRPPTLLYLLLYGVEARCQNLDANYRHAVPDASDTGTFLLWYGSYVPPAGIT